MAQVLKPEVREAIRDAALVEFARHGYRDATLSTIARAAGISTANVYRYFATKEALFLAVVPDELVHEHDRLLDARVAALASSERASQPARDLLAFWVEHRLAVATMLDPGPDSPRSDYGERFVDRLIAHVEADLGSPLDATGRGLLSLVFENTRRSLATLLRSTDRPEALVTLVEGFWSYQVPGLDGLIGWIRRGDGSSTR